MAHTITLDVPEEVYASLIKMAHEAEQPPEDLVVRWVIAITHSYEPKSLPKFIGAFSSNIPDWADRHDYYIGQALMASMRPNQEADSESG